MRIARLSWIVLLLIAGTQFTLAQQAKQKKILVRKEMSMTKTDSKTVVASESIFFEAGFEAKEGCYLYASILDSDDFSEGTGEPLVESFNFEVYPTVTTDKVNLDLRGATDPVIRIYDERNGAEVFHSTDGSLSEVSLAAHGKGNYIIRIVSGEEILFRRVMVK